VTLRNNNAVTSGVKSKESQEFPRQASHPNQHVKSRFPLFVKTFANRYRLPAGGDSSVSFPPLRRDHVCEINQFLAIGVLPFRWRLSVGPTMRIIAWPFKDLELTEGKLPIADSEEGRTWNIRAYRIAPVMQPYAVVNKERRGVCPC